MDKEIVQAAIAAVVTFGLLQIAAVIIFLV